MQIMPDIQAGLRDILVQTLEADDQIAFPNFSRFLSEALNRAGSDAANFDADPDSGLNSPQTSSSVIAISTASLDDRYAALNPSSLAEVTIGSAAATTRRFTGSETDALIAELDLNDSVSGFAQNGVLVARLIRQQLADNRASTETEPAENPEPESRGSHDPHVNFIRERSDEPHPFPAASRDDRPSSTQVSPDIPDRSLQGKSVLSLPKTGLQRVTGTTPFNNTASITAAPAHLSPVRNVASKPVAGPDDVPPRIELKEPVEAGSDDFDIHIVRGTTGLIVSVSAPALTASQSRILERRIARLIDASGERLERLILSSRDDPAGYFPSLLGVSNGPD